ncbi:MAG: hypothetical protein ACLFNT_08630 [Spirochaetales bacterium]
MQRFWQRASLFATMLALVSVAAAGQPRVNIAVGHNGPVTALESHPEDPMLFSGGEDGVVMVWDTLRGVLVKRLFLSSDPITHISHHPSRNEIFIHSRHSAARGTVVAYDWENENVLFEREVEATPNYIGYSPGGTLAVVALPDFDSMLFFAARTGNVRSYLTDGFGAVSFVIVARSERNVMTYIPSRGEIIYWELRTGREIQVVDTAERLEHVTFVDPQTQRFLAASDGENLVVVDNVTGQITSSYELTPILDIAFDAESGDIFVLSERFNRPTVLAFRQQAGSLRRQSYSARQFDRDTTVIAAVTGNSELAFVGGSAMGSLATYAEGSGRRVVLAPEAPSAVRALAFVDNTLHLTQDDRLISLESDLFSGVETSEDRSGRSSEPTIRITTFETETRRIGDLSSFSISSAEPGLLMWSDERPGQVWITSDERDLTETVYNDTRQEEIVTARVSDGALVVVHRSGRVVLFPDGWDQAGISFTSTGVRDAVWDRDVGLIVARSESDRLDSSLIIVDMSTGETATVDSEAFLTDRVEFDHERNVLYAVSLVGEKREPFTVLRRYSGSDLQSQRVLVRREGDALPTVLSFDQERGALFAALDGEPMREIGGDGSNRIEGNRLDTRAIAVNNTAVAAANADGSISIYWKGTSTHLADVYFADGGWIFATDQHYLLSAASLTRYVSVSGVEAEDALERQELELPLLLRPDF